MNIHKFNVKPKHKLHKTIKWIPLQNLKYPAKKVNSITWEIFNQEDIKLQPKEVKQLKLGLGFMMSEGIVLTGLANSLREKRCSIQNEVNLENTNDIITTISNNSKETVSIGKKTSFYVSFVIKNYDYNKKNDRDERERYIP